MRSTKKRKPAKAKTTMRVKDLRPIKDAKAGAQKKEGPEIMTVNSPLL